MTRTHGITAAIAIAFAAGLVGCDDATTAPPPPASTVALIPAVWYLHQVDGADVPAMVSERLVGVAQEQTFVDSGRVVVYSNGTYEQRYWTRVLVTGNLDRAETVIDLGTWSSSGGQHNFESNVRSRSFTWFTPTLGEVESLEHFATHTTAPENQAHYRLTRP